MTKSLKQEKASILAERKRLERELLKGINSGKGKIMDYQALKRRLLRAQLKEGAIVHAERDRVLAREWFLLEEGNKTGY